MDPDLEMFMQAGMMATEREGISCPDHPTSKLIEDHRSGDYICADCGLVVMDRIVDERAEWRVFNDESGGHGDNLDRVGAGEDGGYHAGDLSTKIGDGDYGDTGNLVQQQQRATSSQDRVFTQAANAIRETVAKIHLVPSIEERALKVLRQMQEGKKLQGKSVEVKAAGCLYYACRLEQAPRAIKEISEVTSIATEKITQCFKIIKTSYVEDPVAAGEETRPAGIANITPEDLMARYCARLDMPNSELLKAMRMAARIQKMHLLYGRNVSTIAAAAILMTYPSASYTPRGNEFTAVAKACGISSTTLRSAFEELTPTRGELLYGDEDAEMAG